MTLKKRAVSGVTWSSVAFAASQAVQVATGVLLARLLLPADFGTAGLALAIAAVLSAVTQLGLFASIVQTRELTREHFDTALWTSLGSGAFFGLALLLFASPLAAAFRNPGVAPVLRAYALLVFSGSLSAVQSGLLSREFRFREKGLIDLASRFAGGILSIGLALAGSGVMSIAWGYVLQMGLAALLQTPIAFRIHRPGRSFSTRAFRELFRYGAGMMGANLLDQLSAGLDVMLVGRLLGPARLGFYSLAAQGGRYLPRGLNNVLATVTFSAFSRVQDDRHRLRSAYLRLSAACALTAGSVAALLIAASPDLVPTLFGPKWAPAIPLLQLLSGAGLVMTLDWLWCETLKASGRTSRLFFLNALRIAALVLAVMLGARLGLVWVAAFMLILRAAFWLAYQAVVGRTIELPFSRYARTILRPLLVATVTGVGAFAIRRAIPGLPASGSWSGLAVTLTAGTLLMLLATPLVDPKGLLSLLDIAATLPIAGPLCRRISSFLGRHSTPLRNPGPRAGASGVAPDSGLPMPGARRPVCVMTIVHPADDVRIYRKQALTLAQAGYDVTLLVRSGQALALDTGVRVVTVKTPAPRLLRMTVGVARFLAAGIRLRAEVYHLHDPELLPAGLVLKLLGRRVIYDVHEDYPEQILSKHYLAPMLRRTVSGLLRALEQTSARALSAVVAATETIAVKFPPDRTAVVRNYPLANRQLAFANRKAGRLRVVHLAATLTEDRGITALVQAMGLLDDDFELVLAGRFIPPDYEARLAALPGWRRVRHIPSLPHEQVWDCYAGCDAGAVCLAPLPRYRVSLPVKLFEFMAAGLPVVASDFPLFRRIVEDSDSGICVDPTDPEQIAGAFRFLAEHRVVAAAMAENGRQAVRNQYNWDHEAATLLRTYARLTSRRELGNRRSRFAAGPADAAGTAPGTPAGDQTHV